MYNNPKNSTYRKKDDFNKLDILRQQLTKFQSSDLILIGRDFNSREGTEPDFISENENDFHFLPEGYELYIVNSSRNNQDLSVNEYGRQLIDLCIASKLRISNGVFKNT